VEAISNFIRTDNDSVILIHRVTGYNLSKQWYVDHLDIRQPTKKWWFDNVTIAGSLVEATNRALNMNNRFISNNKPPRTILITPTYCKRVYAPNNVNPFIRLRYSDIVGIIPVNNSWTELTCKEDVTLFSLTYL
jgi:hypothetical protein